MSKNKANAAMILYLMIGIVIAAAANTIESTSAGITLDPFDTTVDIDGTLNTGQGDYELYAMDQDVETTDSVSFDAVSTDLISDAGVIDIQASGDSDDYIEFKTTANIPFITAKGAALNIDSDTSTIRLRPDNDIDDYLEITTSSNTPYIKSIGASGLTRLSNDVDSGYVEVFGNAAQQYVGAVDPSGKNIQLIKQDGSNGVIQTNENNIVLNPSGKYILPNADAEFYLGSQTLAFQNVTAYEFYDKASGKYTKDYKTEYGKTAVKSIKDINIKPNGEWEADTVPDSIKMGDGFWQKDCGEGCTDIIPDAQAKGNEESLGYEHHVVINLDRRHELAENAILELSARVDALEQTLCSMGQSKYC